RVFRYVAAFSILPILVFTHLPAWSLWAIVAFFPLFMVAMSGRFIPMQALMTTVPEAQQRGAFMSITTAMQSLGAGVGAWVGGLLLSSGPNGEIVGYGLNGWISTVLTVLGMVWIGRVVSNSASPSTPSAAMPIPAAASAEP